jgi:ankyrin repeat protein
MWPFRNKTKPLDPDGRSDLHYSAGDGDFAAVQKLVARGADVNLKDKHGRSPLHFAAQARSEEITTFLLAHGASVDLADSHGNTPLFRATFASQGDGGVIRALRKAGADPRKKNKSGVSALSLARTIANYDIAQFYNDIKDP